MCGHRPDCARSRMSLAALCALALLSRCTRIGCKHLAICPTIGMSRIPARYNTQHGNPIQSNPIQSNPIQSNPIQSNPIQCNAMQCNPIQPVSVDRSHTTWCTARTFGHTDRAVEVVEVEHGVPERAVIRHNDRSVLWWRTSTLDPNVVEATHKQHAPHQPPTPPCVISTCCHPTRVRIDACCRHIRDRCQHRSSPTSDRLIEVFAIDSNQRQSRTTKRHHRCRQ
jgi:hypothetical protein